MSIVHDTCKTCHRHTAMFALIILFKSIANECPVFDSKGISGLQKYILPRHISVTVFIVNLLRWLCSLFYSSLKPLQVKWNKYLIRMKV